MEILVNFREAGLHKKLFNALYALNIIGQAIFTLIIPAAAFFAIGWALDTYLGVGGWIYAVTVTLGVLIGFYSMIRFTLSAMRALERLEGEQSAKDRRDGPRNRNSGDGVHKQDSDSENR